MSINCNKVIVIVKRVNKTKLSYQMDCIKNMENIIWTNRYSQTDNPDKIGRWARIGYLEHKSKDPFKRIEIAWIKKHEDKLLVYVYLGSGKFNKELKDLEAAKQYCEDVINDFYNDYLKD